MNGCSGNTRTAPRHAICGPDPGPRSVRIALFGGTFDPPHLGHLVVAGDVHHRLGLDRVVWVPAADPPHKRGMVGTPAALRLEMVRAAAGGDPRFEVDDLELRRPGPSYTLDTLREFRRRLPDAALHFLIGADALREFHTWREPDAIVALATPVVFAREGDHVREAGGVPAIQVPVTRVDISSTEIRRRVAAGEPVRNLVPDAVLRIIEREGLYARQ